MFFPIFGALVLVNTIKHNALWYGFVRDYEAKIYQFTPTFFTSRKRLQTAETRMHYTITCWHSCLTVFQAL